MNFCILIQGLLRQHNGSHAKMSFNIPLLKSNSEFSCAEPCHAWQKVAWGLKNVCKNSGSFKISQKDILQLSKAFLHVQGCFIPQKNSRTSFYSWLKGFSDTSNYDRKISKQSYDTNFGTPCSRELKVMRHGDGVEGADLAMRRENSSQEWSRSLRKLNVQLIVTLEWMITDKQLITHK